MRSARVIALILLLASPAVALDVCMVGFGSATCSTVFDNVSSTTGNESVGRYAAQIYLATSFTPGADATLCKVGLWLAKVNSPTFNLTVTIATDNSNAPNAVIATSTTTVASATLGTTAAEVSFEGLNVALTSGTRYWIILAASALGDTNYVNWQAQSAAFGNFVMKDGDGVAPWTIQNNSERMRFNAYR